MHGNKINNLTTTDLALRSLIGGIGGIGVGLSLAEFAPDTIQYAWLVVTSSVVASLALALFGKNILGPAVKKK